jgi:transglutaminase-like putative cysteine protease
MASVALPRATRAPAPALARPERARLAAFAALGLFGALNWGALIRPARSGDMLLALVFALAGAGALIAIPRDAPVWRRRAMLAGLTLALLVLALLTAGVPLRLLGPKAWGDLVSGMADGISSTPGITVPYRGLDEWVQIAILSGGTALLALAALLAFWPRRSGAFGHPLAAAVALATLYAVPIIEHSPDSPYVGGTVFCILLAAFLWLERLRSDQLAVGGACVLLAAIAGAVIAPRVDGTRPWFDYESFAEKLEPKKAEAFSWTHSYGPLQWPRDGREMLRIKTRSSTYWKVVNLDDFDGARWRQGAPSRDDLLSERPNSKWIQPIRVVDRGLRSHEFVGAGIVMNILPGASRDPLPQADGTYVTASKPLRPGDTYQALVYVPHPTEGQLKKASTNYPAYTASFLEASVPVRGGSTTLKDKATGKLLGPNALLRFTPYGQEGGVGVVWPSGFGIVFEGEQVLNDSPYQRLWALTQQLKRQTHSAYEFVQAVQARVNEGAVYDESPPARPYPIASFLFDTKAGYCQQFSGVMALMLRMGGIPARVASGFSPGTYNSDRKDWVVRDTDAHSWVEAYFRPYGWITFDPTPAASPANSQLDDASGSGSGGPAAPPNLGLGQSGDRPFAPGDPGADIALQDQGGGWKLPVGAGLAVLLLSIGGLVLWRRRVPFVPLAPELAELQLALHRSRRHPSPDVTLARLEGLLGGSDAAAAYVRAVRDRRYRQAAPGPTPAQRRALRRQLGAGLGLRGTLRAWWALPPAPTAALKSRWRRPYTGT